MAIEAKTADEAIANERQLFREAIKTATFVTPRVTGALVKASHMAKPVRDRSNELDLAIAFTADLIERLTELRVRLGWNRGERS